MSLPSPAKPQALEIQGAKLREMKRKAKFMSPEWKELNHQAADNARATETAWREYSGEIHRKMINNL
jgi:hypothetical protein